MAHVHTIWINHPTEQLTPASSQSKKARERRGDLLCTAKQRSPFSCSGPSSPFAIIVCILEEPDYQKKAAEVIRNWPHQRDLTCLKTILWFWKPISISLSKFIATFCRKTLPDQQRMEYVNMCMEQTSQQKPLSEWYLISKLVLQR